MTLPELKLDNNMDTIYIGYTCPRCNTKINVGVGSPACPDCGKPMVADAKPHSSVYANITCKKCGAVYGLAISDKCACGERFE